MFDITRVNSQPGRVAIVTGANVGLGFETTKALVHKGFTVIMACRSEQKANVARLQILNAYPKANLHFLELDLSRLASVRHFANEFKTRFSQLDLLMNNAGVMIPPYAKTEDGFELQMASNYFGHFLLTSLLLPTLEATPKSRTVNLSSIAHRSGKLNFDDLHFEKKYSRIKAYSQSKLAMLMFTYQLQSQLSANNYQTISVAAHPGVSNTNLPRYIPGYLMKLVNPLLNVMAHSPDHGAQPQLYAALGAYIKGGDFTGPNGFREMKGEPVKVKPKPHALNEEDSLRLWNISCELTDAKWF